MATYILFWNPAISSYTMERFKDDFNNHGQVGNWSFHEHEKVKYGDKFYMVRCGEGNVGIVMQGIIESRCYEAEDWSPKNRKPIFYADIWGNVVIDSDNAPKLLTPAILTEAIPDFNWYGGHSGRLLSDKDANILNKLFVEYLDSNPRMFPDKAHLDFDSVNITDNNHVIQMLTKKYGKKCEICGYDYENNFGKVAVKKNHLKVPFDFIVSDHLPRLLYRLCPSCRGVPHETLVQRLGKLKDSDISL